MEGGLTDEPLPEQREEIKRMGYSDKSDAQGCLSLYYQLQLQKIKNM